ncbi:hypothetical protein [Crossiella cryophila]|uniref:Uncharacterized protein n=1 Tax=Crossiella cryophila TaxID=43355 RepID=A0A7W7CGL0_9PSEU|nr:hypothetical protein [Crossiella cryophila]MBB4680847.1 hypothetical protein [Crossiella cryophila]
MDRGSPDLAAADHLARALVAEYALPATTTVCTHLIRTDTPHVALSFEVPADFPGPVPSDDSPGATTAATEHRTRNSGRAVLFPGAADLTGTVPLTSVLSTAITHLTVLGGAPPTPNATLHTRDHIRPEWREGNLTLTITPAGTNTYAPFEVPNPTPCCADH